MYSITQSLGLVWYRLYSL